MSRFSTLHRLEGGARALVLNREVRVTQFDTTHSRANQRQPASIIERCPVGMMSF